MYDVEAGQGSNQNNAGNNNQNNAGNGNQNNGRSSAPRRQRATSNNRSRRASSRPGPVLPANDQIMGQQNMANNMMMALLSGSMATFANNRRSETDIWRQICDTHELLLRDDLSVQMRPMTQQRLEDLN